MVKNFDDENFNEEVIEASKNKPVLVDFFAAWCGPCKIQGPVINELAEEMGDKVIVGKADTEVCPEVSAKYGIMSIPDIMIFKNGEVVENLVGLRPKDSLKAFLEKYL